MSKQYMTIQFGDRTAIVRTNSEKAIKNALGKLRIHSNGTVVSFVIKGDVIEFEGTSRKSKWGYWEPTYTYRARIIENTFATEETAEVVEVPVAEVVAEDTAEVIAFAEGRNEVKVYAETMSVADIEAHIAAYTSLFTDHLATVFANGMRSELNAIISAKRQRVAKLIATTYRKLMDSLRTCDGKNMVYHRQLERLGNVELTLFNSYISTK